MSIITQEQIDLLKSKGLTEEKIQALAKVKGFELPKESTTSKIVGALTKSEKGFGQSIAGALGSSVLSGTKQQIENVNTQQQQIQTNLLNRIKEKREKGEDTTRLLNALKTLDQEVNFYDILNSSTGGSLDKTAKQVFGEGLGVGVDILSAGALPGALGKVTKTSSITQGIKAGAKTGSITGSIIGAGQGLTSGMQDNLSTGEIVGQTIRGGVGGGITGGIVGGTIGGISGGISGRVERKLASQKEAAINAITPNTKNIPKKEYDRLLSSGRIKPKTATKGSQYILSEAEKNTANKYSNLLTAKDPVKNHYNILNEIAKQDEAVGQFLNKNNTTFKTNELKNSIRQSLKDITDISIDEKIITKNKNKLIDNFIKTLKTNDMENLWIERKAFDQAIEKSFTGSPTLQNKIKREFRNSIQKFIADKTPDKVYSNAMKEMTNLYRLETLVKNKAITEKGQSALKLWIKENPVKAKIIGWGVPTFIGGKILLD